MRASANSRLAINASVDSAQLAESRAREKDFDHVSSRLRIDKASREVYRNRTLASGENFAAPPQATIQNHDVAETSAVAMAP